MKLFNNYIFSYKDTFGHAKTETGKVIFVKGKPIIFIDGQHSKIDSAGVYEKKKYIYDKDGFKVIAHENIHILSLKPLFDLD